MRRCRRFPSAGRRRECSPKPTPRHRRRQVNAPCPNPTWRCGAAHAVARPQPRSGTKVGSWLWSRRTSGGGTAGSSSNGSSDASGRSAPVSEAPTPPWPGVRRCSPTATSTVSARGPSDGSPTRTSAGDRARRRPPRSGSPIACRRCLNGCSTPSSCTSSPTWCTPITRGRSMRWRTGIPSSANAATFLDGFQLGLDGTA